MIAHVISGAEGILIGTVLGIVITNAAYLLQRWANSDRKRKP